MCPLRLILVFLSATLAGFFVLRNFKSKPEEEQVSQPIKTIDHNSDSLPRSKKIVSGICTGFWVCVDMASGKYLWRNLTSAGKNDS
ncbi:hypothetical protein IFM89_033544 [Coptis chinensis]|uniref:Uncharacterized protein n=1 Tax=Coptis chinensis TaxID=261450 RepID=A0A835H9S4_9MAGN|nr:hypothetical protein IFM89_033544 [Coptis chinensis]